MQTLLKNRRGNTFFFLLSLEINFIEILTVVQSILILGPFFFLSTQSFLSGPMNTFFSSTIWKQPWPNFEVVSTNLKLILSRVCCSVCISKDLHGVCILFLVPTKQSLSITKSLVTLPQWMKPPKGLMLLGITSRGIVLDHFAIPHEVALASLVDLLVDLCTEMADFLPSPSHRKAIRERCHNEIQAAQWNSQWVLQGGFLVCQWLAIPL